jgi:holo-[acyl-carrier protein] synthase
MIVGVGVDIIEIERIENAVARHGNHFLEKLFTPAEIAYCNSRWRAAEHLAGRFAAKEAVLKALGTGIRWGSACKEIEVLRTASGEPGIKLAGRVAERARELGADRIHISLSHSARHAVAQAVAEKMP